MLVRKYHYKNEQQIKTSHRIEISIVVDNADHNLPPRPLELNDITMKFQLEKGDKVQRDCNCDSQYILSVMEEVGESIRQRRWTRHERSD